MSVSHFVSVESETPKFSSYFATFYRTVPSRPHHVYLLQAAHIAMIEAIMELYTNEVVSADRVVAAVQRFTHGAVSPAMPASTEEGLLLWVNQAQAALAKRIALEGVSEPPRFPPVRDVKGLSDGAGLAALVSFYCPEELPWQKIKVKLLGPNEN